MENGYSLRAREVGNEETTQGFQRIGQYLQDSQCSDTSHMTQLISGLAGRAREGAATKRVRGGDGGGRNGAGVVVAVVEVVVGVDKMVRKEIGKVAEVAEELEAETKVVDMVEV